MFKDRGSVEFYYGGDYQLDIVTYYFEKDYEGDYHDQLSPVEYAVWISPSEGQAILKLSCPDLPTHTAWLIRPMPNWTITEWDLPFMSELIQARKAILDSMGFKKEQVEENA